MSAVYLVSMFCYCLSDPLGFPSGSVVKNLPENAGDAGSVPGWGKSPGEGNGNTLQYFCLGNPVDRGAWQVILHGVEKQSDMTGCLNNINVNILSATDFYT